MKPGKPKTIHFNSLQPRPFSVMAKPIGSVCNLSCVYCYYLEKKNLFAETTNFKMSEIVLEQFIKQYIESQRVQHVSFLWQGGEPALMDLDFYKKALFFQRKYGKGKIIENAFQTNGTLLTDEWCRFFHDNQFLIGISIDGPKDLHNQFRVKGKGQETFDDVIKTIEMLKKHKVEFNTMTVVNNSNVDYPLEVYHFLKSIGSGFIQFIPVVERIATDQSESLKLITNEYNGEAQVTDWSVNPVKYGQFLIKIFDEWVKSDVGNYFIQLFDVTLANWVKQPCGLCLFEESCGQAGVIEHNGDVFSCDHYVYPQYKLGNIQHNTLFKMMNSTQQHKFGMNKKMNLPNYCFQCDFIEMCNGECPKKRFIQTPDGEQGLNYLCEGYKLFFVHVKPYMDFMANELSNQRAPANVMNWKR